jgi:hypothetical protein
LAVYARKRAARIPRSNGAAVLRPSSLCHARENERRTTTQRPCRSRGHAQAPDGAIDARSAAPVAPCARPLLGGSTGWLHLSEIVISANRRELSLGHSHQPRRTRPKGIWRRALHQSQQSEKLFLSLLAQEGHTRVRRLMMTDPTMAEWTTATCLRTTLPCEAESMQFRTPYFERSYGSFTLPDVSTRTR